jgi:hypothetical protein
MFFANQTFPSLKRRLAGRGNFLLLICIKTGFSASVEIHSLATQPLGELPTGPDWRFPHRFIKIS